APEAHGLPAGGAVERLRDRRPPVDDHRLLVGVGHRDAADVERLVARGRGGRTFREGTVASRRGAPVAVRTVLAVAVGALATHPFEALTEVEGVVAVEPPLEVDATEAERGVAEVQLLQAGEHRVPQDVALVASLVGPPARSDLDHGLQSSGGRPGLLEAA